MVTVEESGTKVNPEESQHTGLLTRAQIEQIQTKGCDVANLLRLLPGVRYGDDVEALGESFGTELPNIGGQRKHWNHVSIDGVMGNEIGGSNRVAQQINLDAIEEVKVLLNNYRAEYGRGGGAYVQIVSPCPHRPGRGGLRPARQGGNAQPGAKERKRPQREELRRSGRRRLMASSKLDTTRVSLRTVSSTRTDTMAQWISALSRSRSWARPPAETVAPDATWAGPHKARIKT